MTCGGVYFVPALTMVTKWSPTPPFALGQDPKGVLAGPGTPRDPKSHLFVTKWVAVTPFGTWGPDPGAEFRCESRQGGPAPSISIFVDQFGTPKCQNVNFCELFENELPPSGRIWGPMGPKGSMGKPQNLALAWLACLLCPVLAWSGLRLSCLPCQQQQQRRRSRRRPPKAAGCCCWTRPRQGRQGRPRPDQAKAGHNRQASQAKTEVPHDFVDNLVVFNLYMLYRDCIFAL